MVAIPSRFVACIVFTSFAACDSSDRSPTAAEPSPYLAGEALGAVQGDGQFRLSGPTRPGEISETQAREMASEFAHSIGRWVKGSWEADRGAVVDIEALHPCGRAFYAESAYEDLPETAAVSLRQLVGPKWLVTLCGKNRDPQVSVAVPTIATTTAVVDDKLRITNGRHFIAFGIPAQVGAVPPSPEEAAESAARGTGRRVVSIPHLVLPPLPFSPQLAKWRFGLEAPVDVTLRSSGESLSTSEVYYGFGESWNSQSLMVGKRVVPEHEIRDFRQDDTTVLLRLRPGFADRFEQVRGSVR